MNRQCRAVWILILLLQAPLTLAAELPTFAGPAMGTTYRVTLAREPVSRRLGELHRAVDRLLARIDRSLSTWRTDSDASRLNAAGADAWVEAGVDLDRVVRIAQEVHRDTGGRFDITVAPLVGWWRSRLAAASADELVAVVPPPSLVAVTGSELLEVRGAATGRPPAIRKQADGVRIDLSAIGPGYAVDEIGDLLLALGSAGHLVELGGEVRAWGRQADGRPWRVAVSVETADGLSRRVLALADGEAVAVAAAVPDRPVVDPRTGRLCLGQRLAEPIIRAASCAVADALATAAVIQE